MQLLQKFRELKEMLTDEKMKKLFGTSYNFITYYNVDKKEWNVNNGHGKENAMDILKCCDALKNELASHNIEIVAFVTMPVDSKTYKKDIVSSPRPTKDGEYCVGTVVLRDINSGRIKRVNPKWLGVNTLQYGQTRTSKTAEFASNLRTSMITRSHFWKIYGRQK